MKTTLSKLIVAPLGALLLASFLAVPVADAKERGGGGGSGARKGGGDRNVKVNNSKSDVRSTKVRNTSVTNVNRNTNINRNTNVDIDIDNDRGGWDDHHHHPIATAAAVTATVAVTSAVVGSMVRTLPPACVPVNYGGVLYQQCGTVWYQPQYVGSNVQYIVITQPY